MLYQIPFKYNSISQDTTLASNSKIVILLKVLPDLCEIKKKIIKFKFKNNLQALKLGTCSETSFNDDDLVICMLSAI